MMPLIKIILITAAGLLFLSSSVLPATGMVEMLNLTGARQVACGETGALFEHDPFNLEYNPATVVGVGKGQLGFSHNELFQDRHTDALAMIFPVKNVDFGIHLRLSGTGDIEARQTATSQPDYIFNAHDFAIKFFSGFSPIPKLKAGLSLGWLMEKIDRYQASGCAVGAGLLYSVSEEMLVHGSVANLGAKFKFRSEENDLPAIYRIGLGYRRYNGSLAADYVNVKSGDSHFHLGGEYLLREILFLRAGYQTGYDNRNYSLGAGFMYKIYRIDYAFVPYQSDLGNVHQITLNISLK